MSMVVALHRLWTSGTPHARFADALADCFVGNLPSMVKTSQLVAAPSEKLDVMGDVLLGIGNPGTESVALELACKGTVFRKLELPPGERSLVLVDLMACAVVQGCVTASFEGDRYMLLDLYSAILPPSERRTHCLDMASKRYVECPVPWLILET